VYSEETERQRYRKEGKERKGEKKKKGKKSARAARAPEIVFHPFFPSPLSSPSALFPHPPRNPSVDLIDRSLISLFLSPSPSVCCGFPQMPFFHNRAA
jgi:hypothetical protein